MGKKLQLVMITILLLVSLGACGSQAGARGVSDGAAELVVLDYLDEHGIGSHDYNSYSFEIVHNYDKGSSTDAAVINLKIEYTYASDSVSIPVWYSYNRASNVWSLVRKGNPSNPTTVYNGNALRGTWNITNFGNDFNVEVQSMSNTEATVKYSAMVFAKREPLSTADKPLLLDGEGVFTVQNGHIEIRIDLPEGFLCQKSFQKEDTALLVISIHRQLGLDYGFIDGDLLYQ